MINLTSKNIRIKTYYDFITLGSYVDNTNANLIEYLPGSIRDPKTDRVPDGSYNQQYFNHLKLILAALSDTNDSYHTKSHDRLLINYRIKGKKLKLFYPRITPTGYVSARLQIFKPSLKLIDYLNNQLYLNRFFMPSVVECTAEVSAQGKDKHEVNQTIRAIMQVKNIKKQIDITSYTCFKNDWSARYQGRRSSKSRWGRVYASRYNNSCKIETILKRNYLRQCKVNTIDDLINYPVSDAFRHHQFLSVNVPALQQYIKDRMVLDQFDLMTRDHSKQLLRDDVDQAIRHKGLHYVLYLLRQYGINPNKFISKHDFDSLFSNRIKGRKFI